MKKFKTNYFKLSEQFKQQYEKFKHHHEKFKYQHGQFKHQHEHFTHHNHFINQTGVSMARCKLDHLKLFLFQMALRLVLNKIFLVYF